MLKESILLVASTGLVIYFITPSEEPKPVEPVQAEVQEVVQPVAPVSDDSWEDDETEESDDENFVFGEPMVVAGSESEDQPWDEDNIAGAEYQSDNKKSRSRSFGGSNEPSSGSPRPGELGSLQNPIERNSSGGPDPVDADED
ncbi:MAG: hypothetical protein V7679_05545 [Parasphingorhabdus sp.]